MASALETDPLYQEQYKAGQELLGLYDPAAEAERKKKAWDQASTAIAQRMSGMGYTGSSTDLDTLSRAAKDFNLDWAAREPAQLSAAITGANVPISNLLQSVSQEAEYGGTYGGAPTLAARGLAQQKTLTEEGYQNQRDLLATTIQANAATQGRQFTWQEAQNEADRQITRGAWEQQTKIANLQADLSRELQKGDLASREKIAELNASIQREQLAQQAIGQEAIYGGTYAGQPSLQAKSVAIQESEAAARQKEAEEARKRLDLMLAGQAIGSLGLPQYLSNLLFGTGAGATGTTGVVGTAAKTATQGLIPSAVKWIGEALGFGSDIAKYTPAEQALIDSMTKQDALVELMNLTSGTPGGESISNYLTSDPSTWTLKELTDNPELWQDPFFQTPTSAGWETEDFFSASNASDPLVWVPDDVYSSIFDMMDVSPDALSLFF